MGSYRKGPGELFRSPQNISISIGAPQHFGDDEGTVDEPLVPLPDEPEIVEGDEEEQDENTTTVEQQQTEVPAPQEQQEEPEPENSKPSSPKLSMTLQPSAMDDGADVDNLDPSLQPIGEKLNDDSGGIELDIGPEMDDAHDLSQLDENALISAGLLDESVDPFATQ